MTNTETTEAEDKIFNDFVNVLKTRTDYEKQTERRLWELYTTDELNEEQMEILNAIEIRKEEVLISTFPMGDFKTKSPREYFAFLLGLRLGVYFGNNKMKDFIKEDLTQNFTKQQKIQGSLDILDFTRSVNLPFFDYINGRGMKNEYMLDVEEQAKLINIGSKDTFCRTVLTMFNIYSNIHLDRLTEDRVMPHIDGNINFCFFSGFRFAFCLSLFAANLKMSKVDINDLFSKEVDDAR